ncbi:MAG: hypothetical protein CSB23_04170 [Deltaproteobacteria bacterium]|nr:MAG: hypothetical protein CSB23_04170 [Deltaproteobacteria bacterium]
MSRIFKTTLWLLMTAALAFGFFHHLVPPQELNFERLHIFLFNLVSGGTLILFYTQGREKMSLEVRLFFVFSLSFALAAFCQWYLITLFLPLVLATIVEYIRVSSFGSLIPYALFSRNEPTSRKFHQAAVLCLSLGLLFSSFAILNSEFTHWFELEKLRLDTFFLGYSFPVSLISMSVIFGLMKEQLLPTAALKEFSFWAINLGVIVFFLFILCGWFLPQVFISLFLFCSVGLILHLFWKEGNRLQQKAFLLSGILFLTVTSITGILYIFLEFSDYYDPRYSIPLIRLHAFTALYGWNLSGLVVISRHRDFPIQLHSSKVIVLHWLTVLLLCPLGFFYPPAALVATGCYCWLLFILFFKKGVVDGKILA